MKPGASWREEPWWHWDWPGRPSTFLVEGSGVRGLTANEPTKGQPIANLYVPEAESPTGWRDFWVYRDNPPPPPQRKLGL